MNRIAEIVFGLKQQYCLKDCYRMVESDLHHAVHESNQGIIERLLKEGMSPNQRCQHKITPLQIAVQNNDEKSVDLLIKFGADVNTHVTVIDADETEIDMTPLAIASCLNFGKIVQKLLSASADINENVHERQNALTFALASDANESTKILLDCGASVNNKDANENTPIMIAARYGNPEIITLLLEKGAEINWSNKFGQTALVFAAQRGNVECLERLLQEGADSNIANFKSGNLLIEVLWINNVETTKIVQRLIESGCSVNTLNDFYETPLSSAVSNSAVTETNMLLKAGANPSIGDPSPLEIAVGSGNNVIVRSLIGAGANTNYLIEENCEEETFQMVKKFHGLLEDKSLKNLCRQMILEYLKNKCSKSNMITSVQKLHIPIELKSYLLYDMFEKTMYSNVL